jgi:CRP/FNR family cyclic AMP-dependent transcriptional regulator
LHFGIEIAFLRSGFFKENRMTNCQNCSHAGKHAFCSLGKESQAFLDANAVSMEYPHGAMLFREGDRSSAVFVMCSGKVKVSATSRDGRTMILRIAHPGDVLGMSAALNGADYEVSAEALEPCRVRVLHHKHLKSMLQQYGDASLGVAKALAEDYRAAFEEARLVSLPASPAGRVARLILDWAEHAKKTASPCITMSLTHEEVASMTATTRETVTRTLGRFRKDNVIAIHGIALRILQPQVLEELSAC